MSAAYILQAARNVKNDRENPRAHAASAGKRQGAACKTDRLL